MRLFGRPEQVAVERGLAEFRSGRPIIVISADERVMVLPVDGMTDEGLASFRLVCAPGRPYLLVTARRARALGLDRAAPTGVALGELYDRVAIFSLAADAQVTRRLDVVPAGAAAAAAIELAKLAQLLPALLVCDATPQAANAGEVPFVTVAADAVAQFPRTAIEFFGSGCRSSYPAQRRDCGSLCHLSRCSRRDADRRDCGKAGSRAAGLGAIALGLPYGRRIRFAAMRLRGSASSGIATAGAPRRRDHSLLGAGRARFGACQQDPCLPVAGSGA